MKRIILILCSAMFTVVAVAQNPSMTKFFERNESIKGITSIEVGGSVASSMIKGATDIDISKIRMLVCEAGGDKDEVSPAVLKTFGKDLSAILATDNYSREMSIRDDDDLVEAYFGTSKGKLNEAVVRIREKNEDIVILFLGKFTAKDMQKLVSTAGELE